MNPLWNEVDGVPTITLEKGDIEGPLHACLLFGVGRRDETLLNAGITHAVEHLAFQNLAAVPATANGSVGPTTTRFSVFGDADEVVEFYRRIVQALQDLPVSRLADESRVLQIEASKRSRGQLDVDLSSRFGTKGVGLLDWPEYGLHNLSDDEVVKWSKSWFTAQNAVLWISGPIPSGLTLAELPQGGPFDHQTPPLLTPTRSLVGAKTKTVSVSVLSELQWGVIPFMSIARQRAIERLRQQDALSYAVEFVHVRLGPDRALEYLSADGDGESNQRLFDGLIETLDKLVESGPSASELDDLKKRYAQVRDLPQSMLGYLDSEAEKSLLGMELTTPDEAKLRTEDLSPESVRDDFEATLDTLLAIGPSELVGQQPEWTDYEDWSSNVVEGQSFDAIGGRERGELIVGPTGVSWRLDEHRQRTVLWNEVEGCLTWDSGVRTLLSATGAAIIVTPWNWRNGRGLTEMIDLQVDSARRIDLGEGRTEYLKDANNPESVTDVYWLGTLIGAVYRQQKVSVVITVEGLLVLHGDPPPGEGVLAHKSFKRTSEEERAAKLQERFKQLRAGNVQELLQANKYNRWVPAESIESAKLTKRPFAAPGAAQRGLIVRTSEGTSIRFYLGSENLVRTARSTLSSLLGPKFSG